MSLIATNETTNTGVLIGRLERDKVLSWLGPAFPIVVSALLNLWNLAQNGYSNLYYSVAVPNSQQSSSIALESGQPALAMGGFMGGQSQLYNCAA